MKKLWTLYLKQPWDKKTIWTAAALSLIPIVAGVLMSSRAAPQENSRTPQVDTFIPKGFVLVPIEVQNYEALDSILGQFGVVDLFQAMGPENPQQRLVARAVRILRAPQNPSHFAILVEEHDVPGVLKHGGLFTVIVRRPDQSGTEFVKEGEGAPIKRSIVYEKE